MTLDQLAQAQQQLRDHALVLRGVQQSVQARTRELQATIDAQDAEAGLLTHVELAFDALVKQATSESVGLIESLLTYGLRSVFSDQGLAFRMDLQVKRGAPWMQPRLIDRGVDAPILDAFGGGPASVVAFLLRVVVCRKLGLAPVLLLDEPFAFVSAQYVDAVAKLLRELVDTLGLTIVLVTHEPAFLTQATRAYESRETPDGTTFVPV